MSTNSCCVCNYEFSSVSQKYYCHDKNKPVCVMCRKKLCTQCNTIRDKILQQLRCKKCFATQYIEGSMFYEHQCDSYFCSRCLCKSTVKKKCTVLPCGHELPNQDVQTFMKQFCCKCGKKYVKILDHQLLDYRKVCYACFDIYKYDFKQDIIRCNACNRTIRNTDQAAQARQDIILCKNCYQQSTFEEVNIDRYAQQKRQIIEQKPRKVQRQQRQNRKQQQKWQKKFQNPSNVGKKEQKPEYSLPIESKQEIGNYKQPNQPQIYLESQNIKININKPSQHLRKQQDQFKQASNKKKQRGRQEFEEKDKRKQQQFNSHSKKNIEQDIISSLKNPVLHKLDYSEKQIVQLGSHLKMKKYFSSQTYIENLQIDVKKDNPEDVYVECQSCGYQILEQDTLIQDKVTLCRLCFMIKNASGATYLGFASNKNIDLASSRGRPASTAKFSSPTIDSPTKNLNLKKDNWLSSTQTNDKNFLLNKLERRSQKVQLPDKRQSIKGSAIQPKKQKQYQMKPSSFTNYESFNNAKTDSKHKLLETKCSQCGNSTRSYYRVEGKQMCTNCYTKRRFLI